MQDCQPAEIIPVPNLRKHGLFGIVAEQRFRKCRRMARRKIQFESEKPEENSDENSTPFPLAAPFAVALPAASPQGSCLYTSPNPYCSGTLLK